MNTFTRACLAIWLMPSLVLVLVGSFVWVHLTTPSDGARLEPGELVWQSDGVVVTPLIEQPNGLRRGDVVVAVAGRSMETWAEALASFSAIRPQWQVGQTVQYSVLRAGQSLDVQITLVPYPLAVLWRQQWGAFLFAVAFPLLATFVLLKRPDDRAAHVLFLAWWCFGPSYVPWAMGLQISDLIGGVGFWLYRSMFMNVLGLLGTLHLMFILFPQAYPFANKSATFTRLLYGLPFLLQIAFGVVTPRAGTNTLRVVGWWHLSDRLLLFCGLCWLLITFVLSYQRAKEDAMTRQQIRLIVVTIVIVVGISVVFAMIPELLFGRPWLRYNNVLFLLALQIPAAFALAILRDHLFGIDIIINRTLVYGALTASVIIIYGLAVGTLSALFQSNRNWLISLGATGLIAVLFQPLRDRLQRTVNRWMYGERDDPYTVLARLGQRLEVTLAPDAVLPTIAETVAQTLKLPYTAVAMKEGEAFHIVAAWGQATQRLSDTESEAAQLVRLPLVYQAETLGQLLVGRRAAGEAFTSAEQRLLADIAHQAGIAVHAVRLNADLQRSRERLVTLREDERRRIRRNLHDGLGPTLASMKLKLDALHYLLAPAQVEANAVVTELETDMQDALTDIRRLVYDLRPPALDQLGLVSAIQEYAVGLAASRLQVTVEGPTPLPALPAAVEVAAYRIVLEALTNTVRHAQARVCQVRIGLESVPFTLLLEISDDGVGLPAHVYAGVGLTSMRERAAELGGICTIAPAVGGGTRVCARLPCGQARGDEQWIKYAS